MSGAAPWTGKKFYQALQAGIGIEWRRTTSTNGYRQATLVADPMFMIYYANRNRAAVRTFTSIKDFLDE